MFNQTVSFYNWGYWSLKWASDSHRVAQQIGKLKTRPQVFGSCRLCAYFPGVAVVPALGSSFSQKGIPELGQIWEAPSRISLSACGEDTLKLSYKSRFGKRLWNARVEKPLLMEHNISTRVYFQWPGPSLRRQTCSCHKGRALLLICCPQQLRLLSTAGWCWLLTDSPTVYSLGLPLPPGWHLASLQSVVTTH